MSVLIGVDESGTGAWAGPFTVCAVAMEDTTSIRGVRDSKQLTDKARRDLMLDIVSAAIGGYVGVATVADFNSGLRYAWWRALGVALEHTARMIHVPLSSVDVVVDGTDVRVPAHLQALLDKFRSVAFVPKADDLFPAVSAASIVAKTRRNDLMLDLARSHPEYRWDSNYGYHSKAHLQAIEAHGVTVHHRNIKPLAKYR